MLKEKFKNFTDFNFIYTKIKESNKERTQTTKNNISFFKNKIFNEDAINILKNMDEETVDLILIDPPYGKNYYNNRRKVKGKTLTEKGIENDKDNLPFIKELLKGCYKVLKDGQHLYRFGSRETIFEQMKEMEKLGFQIKNLLIWEKNNHGTGDLFYSYAGKYEFIVYALKVRNKKTKRRKLKKVNGITRHSDILKFKKVSSKNLIHDHQKPTDLLSFLIEKSTNEGEIVADFCCGSGSTLKAAINLNRQFVGVEYNKDIYSLAKNSIEDKLLS